MAHLATDFRTYSGGNDDGDNGDRGGDDDENNDEDLDEQTADAALSDYRAPYHDALYDRDFTAAQRKEAAAKGQAMPGGGFPIITRAI